MNKLIRKSIIASAALFLGATFSIAKNTPTLQEQSETDISWAIHKFQQCENDNQYISAAGKFTEYNKKDMPDNNYLILQDEYDDSIAKIILPDSYKWKHHSRSLNGMHLSKGDVVKVYAHKKYCKVNGNELTIDLASAPSIELSDGGQGSFTWYMKGYGIIFNRTSGHKMDNHRPPLHDANSQDGHKYQQMYEGYNEQPTRSR